MRKILIFIFLFFVYSTSFANSVTEVFSDIDEDYKYISEIQELYDRGIISETESGKLEPYSLITRSDFVGIVSEVSCKKCIQPYPSPDLIDRYSDSSSFYDLSKNNKNFYCIEYANENDIVYGYDEGHTCSNNNINGSGRPFCPVDYVTREEGLAVLLRNSNFFSIEENKQVIKDIEDGKITKSLASDMQPLVDGEVNVFYGYFDKALNYSYQDKIVSENGDIFTKDYEIISVEDGKLNPKEYLNKEDYLRMAYVIFKSNTCREPDTSGDFGIDIKTLDKSCSPDSTDCKTVPVVGDEYIYDFGLDLDENNSDTYTCKWNFHYLGWQKGEYVGNLEGLYIDDFPFTDTSGNILKGDWQVTVTCKDDKGGSATSSTIISIGGEGGISSDVYPISGYVPLPVKMDGIGSSDYNYTWHFAGETISSKNAEFIFMNPGVYPVKLVAIDTSGRRYVAHSTVRVYDKEDDYSFSSKIEIYDADCIKGGPQCDISNISNPDNVYDIAGKTYGQKTEIPDSRKNITLKYLGDIPGKYNGFFKGDYVDNYTFRNYSGDLLSGTWQITFKARDYRGNYSESVATINVGEGQNCYIDGNPVYGFFPHDADFNAVGCGDTENISWDFGDGKTGNGREVSNTFLEPGVYTVKMTSSGGGESFSDHVVVYVDLKNIPEIEDPVEAPDEDDIPDPQAPEEDPEVDSQVDISVDYSQDSGSVCQNGFLVNVDSSTIGEKYFWNFGENSSIIKGKNVTYTYSSPGNYKIVLNVIKSDGNTYVGERNIKVGNFTSETDLLEQLLACNSKIEDDNECAFDSDSDGINDCLDKCPLIYGVGQNIGCPSVGGVCGVGTCPPGFVCSTSSGLCEFDTDLDGVPDSTDECKYEPGTLSNGCPESIGCEFPISDSLIFGEVTAECNTCPCIDRVDYKAKVRKCDVLFGTVLSEDGDKVLSKGNNYRIED